MQQCRVPISFNKCLRLANEVLVNFKGNMGRELSSPAPLTRCYPLGLRTTALNWNHTYRSPWAIQEYSWHIYFPQPWLCIDQHIHSKLSCPQFRCYFRPKPHFLRSHYSSFPLLLHTYPWPSKNSPYARFQNCIYHRYIYIVHAKLDHCNSLFLNTDVTQLNRLKAIQNALARAVTKISKHHHHLRQLFTIQPPRSTRSSSTLTLLRPSVTLSLKFAIVVPLFWTNSCQYCDKYLTHPTN